MRMMSRMVRRRIMRRRRIRMRRIIIMPLPLLSY